jgi:hypothetical protein
MSIIDKVIAAVTPPESDEARAKARARARAAAGQNDWLAMVLNHHEQVEAAFATVKAASDPASRIASLKNLSTLLTGHSIAEEAALYPALSRADESAHATKAYTEHAVAHHVYEEEHNWFLDLKTKTPAADQIKLTQRYQEHFSRYMGEESDI